jgi:hypothetical protein
MLTIPILILIFCTDLHHSVTANDVIGRNSVGARDTEMGAIVREIS